MALGAGAAETGRDSVSATAGALPAGTLPTGLIRAPWTSYLRAGPGREFAVLDEIGGLTWLQLEGCARDWCRVRTGAERVGYIARADLALPASPADVESGGAAPRCTPARLAGYRGGDDEVQVCGR